MIDQEAWAGVGARAFRQSRLGSPELTAQGLRVVGYLADEHIASVAYLGEQLAKPVLIEGPAGTGKTELAKSIALMSGMRLIRLQCYEGLDEAKALYEWNYKKQLLRIQAGQAGATRDPAGAAAWSDVQPWSPTSPPRFPRSRDSRWSWYTR